MNDRYSSIILWIAFYFWNLAMTISQTPATWYNTDHTIWPSAMSGGFLAPQFSNFDLNQNGKDELISFDRFSGIIQVWSAVENGPSYEIRNDLPIEWPVLNSWMLVRDFNLDKIPDIFTQGMHGIAVYKGFKEGDTIRFKKMGGDSFIDDSLIFRTKSGGTVNIYHGSSDIPIIEDVDGDGDLDIMTAEISGSYLYYYENKWDKTGNELDFELKHNCWGYFAENLYSDEINLSKNKLACPPPFSVRHAGTTSCLIDFNYDSIPDLLMGDTGTKSLKILINQGTSDTGFISQVKPVFPDHESPAILHYFPAAYKLDINQDSIPDVVIAVNDYPLTDQEGIWAYTGTGDPVKPFKLHSDHWLSDQYIDLGQYSTPYFLSVNGNQYIDLLVSYQVTENANKPQSRIAYFEALNENEFQLRTLDFGNLSKELTHGYRPYLTAGDVDGDGDLDLLIGMSNGKCYLIRNRSGDPTKFEVENIEEDWMGLNFTSGAAPELFDIDGDGDLDILVGSDNGTINVYINTGDRNKAAFDSNLDHYPNIKKLGQVRTVGENSFLGRSTPRIMQYGSDTILMSGSYEGNLYAYHVNSKQLSSPFPLAEIEKWPKWGGGNSRLTVGQNGKEFSRILIGNIAGGLTESSISLVPTASQNDVLNREVALFPNPLAAGEKLHIKLHGAQHATVLNIYLTSGKLFHSAKLTGDSYQIPTNDWLPGVYFIQIVLPDNKSIVRKIVVQ